MTARDTDTYGAASEPSMQDVSVREIDPGKLAAKLQRLFPADSFEVYVKHNVYCIQAPRSLSQTEIAECKMVDGVCEGGCQPRPKEGRKWPMMFRSLWVGS